MIVDDTRPEFTGEIGVSYADGFLVARWPNTSVVDIDHGPYPLQYTVAIGISVTRPSFYFVIILFV